MFAVPNIYIHTNREVKWKATVLIKLYIDESHWKFMRHVKLIKILEYNLPTTPEHPCGLETFPHHHRHFHRQVNFPTLWFLFKIYQTKLHST